MSFEDLQQKVSQCPADISNIPTNTSKDDDVDPFADNTEEDPFADDTEEDPFGDDTEEDPFADDKKETDKKEIDPFAEIQKKIWDKRLNEDPFEENTEEDLSGKTTKIKTLRNKQYQSHTMSCLAECSFKL